MVRFPSAQPVPRVPRSRRDDKFHKSHALAPKLGGIGIVMTREGETCTVLISEEMISGCIPLTSMPPIGAIVEVESRGDLMVILDWSDGTAQPQLGEWYLTAAESPGWTEGSSDSTVGMGERVSAAAPEGPGTLWNIKDFPVHAGDTLSFTMLVSSLSPDTAATVQLVMCWDVHGSDPQPSTGEVVAYGSPVTVDRELVEFSASATVPELFDKPGGGVGTTGQARIGLRYVPVGT
jgi:hypothetical protein